MFKSFTDNDRLILHDLHRRIFQMDIDVTKLQASADRAAANITKLVTLVQAALAASTPVQNEAVQKQLDAIQAELDSGSVAAETVEAAAAPTGPTGTTPPPGTTGPSGASGPDGTPAPAPAPTGATGA